MRNTEHVELKVAYLQMCTCKSWLILLLLLNYRYRAFAQFFPDECLSRLSWQLPHFTSSPKDGHRSFSPAAVLLSRIWDDGQTSLTYCNMSSLEQLTATKFAWYSCIHRHEPTIDLRWKCYNPVTQNVTHSNVWIFKWNLLRNLRSGTYSGTERYTRPLNYAFKFYSSWRQWLTRQAMYV
jgi:hypothetical protein